MQWAKQKANGFTIVELLIVIVVIAILAAITIVAYNGIQNRAKTAALQNTVSQLARKIEAAKVTAPDDLYPSSLASANIQAPSTVSYSVTTNSKGFCVVATDGSLSYFMTQAIKQPTSGSCTTMDGLLAWWPFNGDSQDISGNGLNGTPINVTPDVGQGGQANTAYSFNGTNAQVRCPDDALLRPTAAITISAWVTFSALPVSGGLAGIVNYGGGGYWMHVNSAGLPSLYISSGTVGPSTALTTNRWYHLVGTFSGGPRVLYIDGVQVASDTGPASITGYGGEVCRIGSVKGIADRYLNGRLDDVRIYNRALSSSEVQTLFTSGAY